MVKNKKSSDVSPREEVVKSNGRRSRTKTPKSLRDFKHLIVDWTTGLIAALEQPRATLRFSRLLLVFEFFLCAFIIRHVNYTEIDWEAYMQEVEGFLNGTLDYRLLEGSTGPLVYPGGFVYIFSAFYYLTDNGKDIRTAQWIFSAVYLLTLVLVFRLYHKSQRIPPHVLFLMCGLSYRIHSIFVLRMFNDCIAMLLLYASANLFVDNWWLIGCLLFSAAVSVKMSVLLFAPALLFLLLQQGYRTTLKGLSICGGLQLVLGAPFLLTNPRSYIERSFDLKRQFFYKWTVNWRFLEEEVFLDRTFHIGLLVIHLGLLVAFLWKIWLPLRKFVLQRDFQGVNAKLLTLFSCNLIGIACSRSLHYQFYVWYFHTLHFLLWILPMQNAARILLLGMIEYSWNTYPSTSLSSWVLLLAHASILLNLFRFSRNTRDLLSGDQSVHSVKSSVKAR
ncbi:hypothetical protein RvY_18642 [Ramazzottius varieornatus]|uniref:dolichyl-P-Man:Man5GlcNAc2-PP-dolichol alpha-1,3-mannosyltransferase n=1 Tax=Ramazzottius varieornatus TaxID=947166 RepID=A0A1D1W6L5_RAMVA|nr:hypothetical protein RvY_18642 [Ramazzottius varieornatus]